MVSKLQALLLHNALLYIQIVCVMYVGISSFCNMVNHGPERHLLFETELWHYSNTHGTYLSVNVAMLSSMIMLNWLHMFLQYWLLHIQDHNRFVHHLFLQQTIILQDIIKGWTLIQQYKILQFNNE